MKIIYCGVWSSQIQFILNYGTLRAHAKKFMYHSRWAIICSFNESNFQCNCYNHSQKIQQICDIRNRLISLYYQYYHFRDNCQLHRDATIMLINVVL